MTREYKTIGECARLWVDGFDVIDSGMIEKLADWEEVTLPSLSDRVYVYDMPVGVGTDERYGEIIGIETDEGEQDNVTYDIELDDGTRIAFFRCRIICGQQCGSFTIHVTHIGLKNRMALKPFRSVDSAFTIRNSLVISLVLTDAGTIFILLTSFPCIGRAA